MSFFYLIPTLSLDNKCQPNQRNLECQLICLSIILPIKNSEIFCLFEVLVPLKLIHLVLGYSSINKFYDNLILQDVCILGCLKVISQDMILVLFLKIIFSHLLM